MDLIEDNQTDFKKYRKAANIVKEMRIEWEKKMEQLQEERYLQKEVETTKRETTNLTDTKYIKRQAIPGPFTLPDEIDRFMESYPESKEKNERMYREVRFHRMTSNRKK